MMGSPCFIWVGPKFQGHFMGPSLRWKETDRREAERSTWRLEWSITKEVKESQVKESQGGPLEFSQTWTKVAELHWNLPWRPYLSEPLLNGSDTKCVVTVVDTCGNLCSCGGGSALGGSALVTCASLGLSSPVFSCCTHLLSSPPLVHFWNSLPGTFQSEYEAAEKQVLFCEDQCQNGL